MSTCHSRASILLRAASDNGPSGIRTGDSMAHAKDKGEKHAKKTAQKSIKEKRAAKKAKKTPAPPGVTRLGE